MDGLATIGKYAGYTFKELMSKYEKIENEWIRAEANYQKELEEINKSIDSIHNPERM